MTTNEKIAALRAAAKAAGGDAVLLMTSDPHCSEYLPDYYNALPWFSGFTGENSTLVVTGTGSALWCDGRFYVQADRQLAGTEIECMHDGSAGVPTVAEYLAAHLNAGQTLLLDGACVPAKTARAYAEALAKNGAALKSCDVAGPIWDASGERPALPATPCWLLTPAQTGATAAQRIEMVRADLAKAGATALAVTGLDCVGWLMNLRARDIPNTPLAVAFALVTRSACTLFLAPGRLSGADAAALAESGVTVRPYGELLDAVAALDAGEVFLVDEAATNYDLYTALCAHKTLPGADPIFARKGVKNEVELQNIRECHIRDGVALVRFEMDLEKALADGRTLHETDIEGMLQTRRAEQPGYFDDSFPALGVLLSGQLQVAQGAMPVSRLEPGDLFGAAALYSDAPEFATTITARRASRCLLFSQQVVDRLLAEDGLVRENYLRYLTGRVRFLSARLQSLSQHGAEGKLARYLLTNQREGMLVCPATELAGRLGVSRASLYRAFQSLEAAGLITRRGPAIEIFDLTALEGVL